MILYFKERFKGFGIVNLIFFIGSIMLLLPYLLAIQYSLPSADDFSMINIKSLNENGVFLTAIKTAMSFYRNWGGGVCGIFIETFVLGFYKTGFLGLHFLLFIVFLFFLFSLYSLVKQVNEYFGIQIELPFFFFILLVGFNKTTPKETFYWAVGSLGYVLFFSTMLFSFVFLLKYLQYNFLKHYLLALVLGIISCSGLPFAGIINFIFLSIFLYDSKKNKRLNVKMFLLFISVFIVSLIVSLAPGNFVRHKAFSTDGLHLLRVVCNTMSCFIFYCRDLMKNSFFIVSGICLFFIVFTLDINKDVVRSPHFFSRHFLIGGLFSFILGYLFLFPVCLGYGGAVHMPSRIVFLFNIIISFLYFGFIIYSAFYFKKKIDLTTANVFNTYTGILMLLYLIVPLCLIVPLKSQYCLIATKELCNGSMKEFYSNGVLTLSKIKESSEKNVIVYGKDIDSKLLKGIGLTNDPENWVNQAVANFYGKESVTYYVYE